MNTVSASGEIIVVDNNSTDATAEVARAHGVAVVFEPHNQISRARNAGGSTARGSVLVFVDADTRLPPELLQASLRLMEDGTHTGGGAPVSFDIPVGWPGRTGLGFWNWISRRFNLAAGSFVFVRRDVFEAVGGFSETIYAGEEIALSRALHRYGRTHGLRFRVLEGPPVLTSARKLEWHASWKLLLLFLLHVFVPFSVRSRRLCGFWYKRPEGRGPGVES